MSRRLWGACASEQGLLGNALGPERLSLQIERKEDQHIGWGIGFYEGGEPLVRKCPREERTELDLLGVVAETRSDLLIGHVRAPTIGSLRSENTHPFRFRHWLMAHSGTIRGFEHIKTSMLDAMPSFLQRSLGGDTDSECFLHLVLSFLHDSRQLDNPRLEASTVCEALAKAVVMVDELETQVGVSEQSAYNVLMSNGYYLVALHRSPHVMGTLTYTAPGRDQVRPRAVLVACEKTMVGSNWTSLPDQSTVAVQHDLSVEVKEF